MTRQPYAYAANSPLNLDDPDGLSPGDWLLRKFIDFVALSVHAVVKAAKSVGRQLVAYAGDIVAGLVTAGCVAAVSVATVGIGALPAAVACGALGGAIGGSIDYLIASVEAGTFTWSGLGKAAGDGALWTMIPGVKLTKKSARMLVGTPAR